MRQKHKTAETRLGEEGFTLVELLIVLGIMTVLIAVVLPNFTGILSRSQTIATDAEKVIIQKAVDTKMADLQMAATTAVTATTDMGTAGFGLYPTYIRIPVTNGIYSCDVAGIVTEVKVTPTPAKGTPTAAKVTPTAAKGTPTAAKVTATPGKGTATPGKSTITPGKITPVAIGY